MSKELSPEEKITLDTYDRQAASWITQHMTKGFYAKEIVDFTKALPSGHILEVGAGAGRDTKELISAGYEYTGTDISRGLLGQARKNNPDVRFDEMSVYDLNYRELFDGFWCAAVLLHIPRENIDMAPAAINKSMKRGAIGFISVKKGIGEQMVIDNKSTKGGKRYFVYWTDNEFSGRLNDKGFEVLKRGSKYVRETSQWLTYIVKVVDGVKE